MRIRRNAVIGAVAGLVGLLGGALAMNTFGSASASPGAAADATVRVTGNAEVSGPPDTLTIQLGVSTNGATALSALSQNNGEMTRLQAALERAGVKARELETNDLELSPNYDSSGTITGYNADDELVATLTNIKGAGRAIDAAASAVGNDVRIEGLSFSLSNTSALLATARSEAMRDAYRAAAALASASGTRVGPVEKITDNEQVTNPPTPIVGFAPSAARASAVPVQAGTEQVSDQVSVVYVLEG